MFLKEVTVEEVFELFDSYEEICRFYERRKMARHDEITRITGAREEGKLEGQLEGRLEVARNMLLTNIAENLIVETTKLPLEKIQKLKEDCRRNSLIPCDSSV